MKIDFHVHLFPDALAVKTIEKLARIPVEAAIASEYRYRDPIIGEDELFIIPMARCGERWKRWMFGAWIVL